MTPLWLAAAVVSTGILVAGLWGLARFLGPRGDL